MEQIFVAAIVNFGRSVVGWLENSLEDGIVQRVEWLKLLKTTVQQVVYTALIFFGASSVGINADVFSASVGAALLSFLEHKFPKK